MKFHFSIRGAIRKSWNIVTARPWYFVVLSAVMLVLSFASGSKNAPITVLTIIGSLIWSYVWLSVALAAVDGKDDLLTFRSIPRHFPSFRQFFMLLGVGLVTGLFVLLGLLGLIIPGIYIMVRLMFANLAYVDRKGRVMQTLRYSWHLVKGDTFWTVFLTMIVSFALTILGMIFFGVGVLITYPISMLLTATLYRALTLYHGQEAIIVQPEELPAPAEAETAE